MPQFEMAQYEGDDALQETTPATQAPLADVTEAHQYLTTQPTGGKEPMPQLQTDFFASQIFWLVLTFVFLWLLLSRRFLPDIHTILENRQTKITHDLDRAEKLRSEADAARENYERALRESRTKAQALIGESTTLMEKSANARHAELDAKLEKQLANAEANIEAAKAQALARLAPVSKELTQEIVEKMTGQKLGPSDVSSVVDSLIKEKRYG